MVAVLSTDAIPQLRLTVDEYLLADLPEGCAYELVNGVVEMTPTASPYHDDVLGVLTKTLAPYYAAHSEQIAHLSYNAGVPIPGRETVREPDVALYRKWDPDSQDPLNWKRYVPFLVVEVVSPKQERRDYEEKREDYWLAGVEEYWIVDRHAKRFTVFHRGPDNWRQTAFPPPEDYQPGILPGLTLDLSSLLRLSSPS